MLKRTLLLLLLACAILGVSGRVAANSSPQHDQIVGLLNSERTQSGLPHLQYHPALESVAQIQANNMAASADVTHFSIDGSNASMRSTTVGYPGEVNEIIFGGTADPNGIVKWWMNSDSHRQIILTDKYTEVGIATAFNAETGWTYWCVIFGAPQADIAIGNTSFVTVAQVDVATTQVDPVGQGSAVVESVPAVAAQAPAPAVAPAAKATLKTTTSTTAPVADNAEPVAVAVVEPAVNAAPPVAVAEANFANSAESNGMQIAAIGNVGMGGGGGDDSYVPTQTSAESDTAATTYTASSSLDPIHLAIAFVAISAASALIFVGYLKPKRHFDPFRRNY